MVHKAARPSTQGTAPLMTDPTTVWPGTAYPLGATYDGAGTNFALFSEVAERVELCLFDDAGTETRVELPEVDGVRLARLPAGVEPGQRYGYRVHGPYDPGRGQRCNPRSCCSTRTPRPSTARSTGTRRCSATSSTPRTGATTRTSAPHTMNSVVVNPYFDWGDDRHPRTPVPPAR